MADLQLALRYTPCRHRHIYQLVSVAQWIFLIILPAVWSLIALAFMLVPSLKPLLLSSASIVWFQAVGVWLMLVPLGYALTRRWTDCRLRLSKDCFVLPRVLTRKKTRSLGASELNELKAGHLWSEVVGADLIADGEGQARIELTLDVGQSVVFESNGFAKSDLEQLLMGIELWGTSVVRTPALIDYQAALQNENKGLDQVSYTHMWEDELNRRFRATTFVPLEPGRTLQHSRLKVLKQLAFGGLSAIYLVQRDHCDLVVLKEAVVPSNSDPELRRQAEKHLVREAEMLSKLAHPYIARVLDNFVEDSRNYLLLEYVSGQDLKQLVRQHGPQPEEKVKEWAMQLANAVWYLHSQAPPIIHRDLTPDNIVLRNDGSVVLIDFGAANEFIGTATGTLIGKQAYIAPEQLRGKASLRSDLYAFGATLFFLLTGRDPVPLSVCRPKTVLPTVSEEMDALVSQLTAFDEGSRLADVKELMDRLARVCQAEVVFQEQAATTTSEGESMVAM